MALSKKPLVEKTKFESGAEGAIERLSKPKVETKPKFVPRDFDKEARGKVRFGMYAAALQSPAIAGMRWDGAEELMKLIRQIADDGFAYSFED